MSRLSIAPFAGCLAMLLAVPGLAGVYDVAESGAVGDGKTNDTAAIHNVLRQPPGAKDAPPVILLDNCRDGLVTGQIPSEGVPAPVELSGKKSADVAVLGDAGASSVEKDPPSP